MRNDGIFSLECMRSRCCIDDETGCWRWSLAINGVSDARCFVRAGALGNDHRQSYPARRAAWLFSGRRLHSWQIVYRGACCVHPDCINPEHAAAGKAGDQLRASVKRDTTPFVAPERLARLHAIRMRQAVTPEKVAEVEAARARGELIRDIAARMSINKTTIVRINQGRHVHQRAQLLRGASVFALAEAA
jgi:hypothetical protein